MRCSYSLIKKGSGKIIISDKDAAFSFLTSVGKSSHLVILTLLSMCGDILVPHIDSRVKIIDNERPGASPCA
jgi:hypothetical protein